MPKTNPEDNTFSFAKRAEYYFGKNDTKTLAKKFGVSERTARRYRSNPDSIPRTKNGIRVRNAILRTGKRYAYREKMDGVKRGIVAKLEKNAANKKRQLDAVDRTKFPIAYANAEDEYNAAQAAVVNAQSMSAEELVGMTRDVNTDRDWAEWSRSYEASKGVIGL